MILDTLTHMGRYAALSDGLRQALAAAAGYPTAPYITGRTEIDGERIILLANEYATKPLTEASRMEAHRRYIDVMVMVEGEEKIFVTDVDTLTDVTQPYDAAGDALLARVPENVSAVRLSAGSFVVLFPEDAHCPGVAVRGSATVRKIIMKLAVEA